MATGQLCSAVGAYDNAAEFSAGIPTYAHYLRAAGYQTALSGKMHFIGPDQFHGFEKRLTADLYPADFAWVPNLDNEGKGNTNIPSAVKFQGSAKGQYKSISMKKSHIRLSNRFMISRDLMMIVPFSCKCHTRIHMSHICVKKNSGTCMRMLKFPCRR